MEVRVLTLHEVRALDIELARIAAERAAAWAREVAAEQAARESKAAAQRAVLGSPR
ncbi:hypothetical protein AB0E11_27695 [Streptomyces fradiae]|uniref:hypothetical protein n=1 Tax=Streptomyces fradiae TaxID=1906 RepID=UPI0033CDB15E